MTKLRVPFEKDGNIAYTRYPERDRINKGLIWKDNYEFDDQLKFICFSNTGHSEYVELESVIDGRKYNMRMNYFADCIRRANNGVGPIFSGRWTFHHVGNIYGVKPVEGK